MPSKNRSTNNYPTADNAAETFKPKTVDGCNTCPPSKACTGPEITFETSGCLDGGGSINLRQSEDQVIPLHVECPENGKLSITTCESITGGGEFTANQKCNTDLELCINNEWLDRFVSSRLGNGKLTITGDSSIHGDGLFTANQGNDTHIVLGVNWDAFPACGGVSGLLWNGSCWRVEWQHFPACNHGGISWQDNCWKIDRDWLQVEVGGYALEPGTVAAAFDRIDDAPDLEELKRSQQRIADLEEKVKTLSEQLAKLMS